MHRPAIRRSIALFAILGLAIAGLAISLAHGIPAEAMTRTSIVKTSLRVEEYFQKNKALLPDLSGLPSHEGHMNSTVDGWKRPLNYAVGTDDTFTLSSLGKDGMVGGEGDDRDTFHRFRIINGEVRPMP